jgi:hypothetical protein
VEIAKISLEFAKLTGVNPGGGVVNGEGELWFFVLQLRLEHLPGAGNGVTLAVEKAFDPQRHLNIATAIETLAGAALVGFQLRKFALPETQHVGWNVAESGDFTNAEVELVRDVRPGWRGRFTDWLMLCHARKTPIPLNRRPMPADRHE